MADLPVKSRTARVEIWTGRYRLLGYVHIPMGGGYKGRLSDVLNEEGKPFLALTDVTLSSLDGQEFLWKGDFLAVNKASIVHVKIITEERDGEAAGPGR